MYRHIIVQSSASFWSTWELRMMKSGSSSLWPVRQKSAVKWCLQSAGNGRADAGGGRIIRPYDWFRGCLFGTIYSTQCQHAHLWMGYRGKAWSKKRTLKMLPWSLAWRWGFLLMTGCSRPFQRKWLLSYRNGRYAGMSRPRNIIPH